jgi:hypothetical protein
VTFSPSEAMGVCNLTTGEFAFDGRGSATAAVPYRNSLVCRGGARSPIPCFNPNITAVPAAINVTIEPFVTCTTGLPNGTPALPVSCAAALRL